jgi:hypothetical protein
MRKDDITNLYNQVSPGVVLFDVFRPTYVVVYVVVFSARLGLYVRDFDPVYGLRLTKT